jgi:hypothetical protein
MTRFELLRFMFSDKRVFAWIFCILSIFVMLHLVETGTILLPGHNCAPDAWPSHSQVPLYVFDKKDGRWEGCH